MITSEIEGSSEGVSEEFASTVETMEADNIQTEEGVSMVEQMEQQWQQMLACSEQYLNQQ